MTTLRDEDISGRVKDNVFYDSFAETIKFYSNNHIEVWDETQTICLFNTGETVGLFDKSDIIVVYDKSTGKPSIVTERIYRKNYKWLEWFRMCRYLMHKSKVIKHELGFNIKICYSKEYIDYVHYKEEWWQWALKNTQAVS